LGIWNLRTFNEALLGKWLWRYAHKREAWWKSVVDAMYRVGLWKNIRKGWSLFRIHTRLISGIGSRIQFWDDVWCGEMPRKEVFPVLYDIAPDKDAHVANHLVVVSGSYQWDVSFFRAAHDWEVDVLASFFSLLYSSRVDREGKDQLWWSPSHKGNLILDLSIMLLLAKRLLIFSGKVFGDLGQFQKEACH
jgi:hypothetical protein